jgi:5-oxoprolinase (ATP-hydrolysing)
MTNTRITDPEILERRFPVILRRFVLREGSGGGGAFRGGDGVVRELEFRRPLVVSILSERRAFQPYGLRGGAPGARGVNLLRFTSQGRLVNLGGKNTVQVDRGDVLTILTPGGGGFGVEAAEGFVSNGTDRERRGVHLGMRGGGSLHQYSIDQITA